MTDWKEHPAVAAGVVAIVGGGFAFLGKWLDHAFGWRRSREEFANQLRDELHEEIEKLRAELDKVRAQAEAWREKYHAEREVTTSLRSEVFTLSTEKRDLMRRLEEEGVEA